MKGLSVLITDKNIICFLKSELKEYEQNTPMTEDERKALRKWVKNGNSVHENMSLAFDEHGKPLDFLEVYRRDVEIASILASMTEEEGDKYLLENYGINRKLIPNLDSSRYESKEVLYGQNRD